MYKKQGSFSFIALFFKPRLSEHDRPGAFGMLKDGVRALTSLDIIIAIHQLNSAPEIFTRLLGELKIDGGLVSQEQQPAIRCNLRRLCIDDIYIDDYPSGWITVSARRIVGLLG